MSKAAIFGDFVALMGTGAASMGPFVAAPAPGTAVGFFGGLVNGVGGGRDGVRLAASRGAPAPARIGGRSGDIKISASLMLPSFASMMLCEQRRGR